MVKTHKIWLNSILVVVTYIIPLYVLNQNQSNYSNIETIQKVVFYTLFLGSGILTYLNYRNIKIKENPRWLWVLFEIVGILGILYSIIILYLIFAFQRGIGL